MSEERWLRLFVVVGGDYGQEIYGVYSSQVGAIEAIRTIIKKEIEHMENSLKTYPKDHYFYNTTINKLKRAHEIDPSESDIAWIVEAHLDKDPVY